jgi:superfamily II DNA helicase RecQ
VPLLTQYRTFFISPFGEASVCDELNAFLKAHRIVNVEKKMIDGERGTGWLFLVEYGDGKAQQSSGPKVDYAELFNKQDYALFEKLRKLRKEVAEKEGLPVYAVFNNDNLVAMVKKRVATLKDLGAIPGVGESRVKKYGDAFIKVIAGAAEAPTGEAPPETTDAPF